MKSDDAFTTFVQVALNYAEEATSPVVNDADLREVETEFLRAYNDYLEALKREI